MNAIFFVDYSQKIADELQALHVKAAEQGLGTAFVVAFREIHRRLQADPIEFGDPLYSLPALKFIVYHRIVTPLVVYYAVHSEKRLVWVKRFKLLSPAD